MSTSRYTVGASILQAISATTISATTYYGLPTDIYTTGGTYSNGTAIFNNNIGSSFSITGFSQSDLILQQKIQSINSNSLLTTIPAGYIVSSIVISENSGNDAGNISIGTTVLGYDVIYNEPITANLTDKAGIGSDFFSLTNTQTLYISSSSWGSANITVYIILNKIIS